MIARDEVHNFPRLFESIKGCYDEIHVTDTGSVDGSQEWVEKHGSLIAGCPVYLHHFKWIDDFAAARNYSFSHAKTDYLAWIDGDDCLHNREAFIKWRNHAMQFADCWYANYHYAIDEHGKPLVTFIRERVVKRSAEYKWNYFVHEGLLSAKQNRVQFINTWAVNHLRSSSDFEKDRSRNLKLLDDKKSELGPRLKFYYGKELFDNNKPDQALKTLLDVAVDKDLELHDRILALQYGAYSAMSYAEYFVEQYRRPQYEIAEKLAKQGVELDPRRAEFHCIIGDSLIKRGKLVEALPYFGAAENCLANSHMHMGLSADALFKFESCYNVYPALQKAKIYYHINMIDKCQGELDKVKALAGETPEWKAMQLDLDKARGFIDTSALKKEVEDIVFTCPPNNAYPFDEVIYQTKPLGGSETALVQMATRLKRLTGRRVIVFNDRPHPMVGPSGVEWMPVTSTAEYFTYNKPKVHIAWRHNIKITDAMTYAWCHDLFIQGVEIKRNFDKMLCLTPFHKNYVQAMQGVPDDQIVLTRNGIDPRKFEFERPDKNPNKLVFMSSPDRGLDHAILIADKMRAKSGLDLELHVYYGLENLYKYGMAALGDKIKGLCSTRPWVKLHSFTEQNKMYREVADAAVWLYPSCFIESFCITALEMLALKIYPVTRIYGALQDTLKEAHKNGHAVLLENHDFDDVALEKYADAALNVIGNKLWEKIEFDMEAHSWEEVAKEWVSLLNV